MLHSSRLRTQSLFLPALLIASLVASALILGESASAVDDESQSLDFAACVAAQGSGSVMVLMDESDTVYGANGKPASDPRNLRVAGAQLLIDDIQRVVDATSVPVNVQLAGLGDNFVSRSSGWTAIQPGDQGVAASELKSAVSIFASRPTDGNQIETDFWSGINGARDAFNSQGQCKLLVVFKDGLDFQKFDAKNSSDFPLEKVQDLLDEAANSGSVTKAREAAAAAQGDICRAKGLADGLRGDGIFTISVGLGEGDFEDLRSFTENPGSSSCGELPGRGYLLRAEDPRDLVNLFARTLNPSNLPSEFDGSFKFEMSPALSSISIVTSGMSDNGQYFITPPITCAGATRTPFTSTTISSSGTFGSGITWTGAGYAEGEALRIFIKRANDANLDCWSGAWTVDPGTEARSSLSIEADLQPFALFEKENPSVQPGQRISFQALLRKISSPGEVGTMGLPGLTGQDLHPDLRVSLSGDIFSPDGLAIAELFDGDDLAANELGQVATFDVPQDLPLGNYVIRLTLALEVEGIDITLSDVRSETVVQVRGAIPLPVFAGLVPTLEDVALFPDILGSNPSNVVVRISNTADKPVRLNFTDTKVTTTQSPENASEYKIAGPSDQVEIPAGESLDVELALSPDSDEQIQFSGQVSGSLSIPVTADGEQLPANFAIEIPFKANQLPDQDLLLFVLFTILFLLLGAALTAGAMWLVSYRVSRFPKLRKIQENVLQSVTLPMVIDPSGLRLLQPLPSFESDQWQPLQVSSRRSIGVGFSQIRAKSPGLRLGRIGFAELVDPSVIGWGMSGSGLEVDKKTYRPRLGLDLQQNFFVTVRPEDVPVDGSMDSQIPGQVTFISSLNSFERNDDLVESARSSALDVLEGLTQSVRARFPGITGQGVFGNTQDPFGQTNYQKSQPGVDPFL